MLDIKQIQAIIPHRAPFLLIDKVLEMNETQITALKTISYEAPYLKGHFPEFPIMPGVLIIEALAQTGAVLLLSKDEFKGKLAFFAGIDKCRFKGKIVPGDTVILKVSLIKIKGPIGVAKAQAFVNDKIMVTAELTFAVGI